MQRNAVPAALTRLHALAQVLQNPQTYSSCSQLGLCAVLKGPASCMPARWLRGKADAKPCCVGLRERG